MNTVGKIKSTTSRRIRKVVNRSLLTLLQLKYGTPDYIFTFRGGLGDQLLSTIPIEHLHKERKNIWFVTNNLEIFKNNKNISFVLNYDLAKRLRIKVTNLSYLAPPINGQEVVPESHIVKMLCNTAGIYNATIALKPSFTLSELEIQQGLFAKNKIIVSTSGKSAKFPIPTKDWFPDYYEEVVNGLVSRYTFIQVGSVEDPLLDNAIDMRGKLSIRETAAYLRSALLYVGQVGFLMHLARAVNCRSVIVYGGREMPSQSGYSGNVNLYTSLHCSPCWAYDCNIDRLCMQMIEPTVVINAIEKALTTLTEMEEEWIQV